jgi:hypothetical protein
MVIRYAVVKNDIIVNVAVADDPAFAESMGWIELPEGAAIGWIKVGGAWEPGPASPAFAQGSEGL